MRLFSILPRPALVPGLILLAAAGCGKKEAAQEPPVRATIPVRVLQAGTPAASETSQATQYSGTVAEGAGTTVSFQVSGTITQLPIEEGQRVRKGQLLAALDGTAYQEQYNAQLAQQRLAEDTYRRTKEVFDQGSVAEARLVQARQQAEQARASARATYQNVAHTRLYAPIDGYIGTKQVDAGAVASPGAPVATIVQLRQVKVDVAVPESEINRLHKGDAASVRVAAVGNKVLRGRLDDISPVADAQAHTFSVSVLLLNAEGQLKPSMTAKVSFDGAARPVGSPVRQLVLPVRAVQLDEQGHHFVYLVQGRKVRWHEVQTGELVGDGLAVTSGLDPQDQVVVEGYHKLYDQASVKIIN
jgi:membrane fusion protein (multidrug efflux system)